MHATVATERKRILVSDDFADFTLALSIFLEEAGYEVRTCLDAPTSLELAQTWQPDLITTDLIKGGEGSVDGLQMIAALKADERTRQIPVLVLSSWAGKPEGRQAAAETSGAMSGARVAAYLRGQGEAKPAPDKILERLAAPQPAAPAIAVAAPPAEPLDRQKLEALTRAAEPVLPAAPASPAAVKAASEADVRKADEKLASLVKKKDV